jgi:hypothetical protein
MNIWFPDKNVSWLSFQITRSITPLKALHFQEKVNVTSENQCLIWFPH